MVNGSPAPTAVGAVSAYPEAGKRERLRDLYERHHAAIPPITFSDGYRFPSPPGTMESHPATIRRNARRPARTDPIHVASALPPHQ
jgi:hypothetical protein